MKINIITCHRAYNYGAVLQAYALEHYLESQGNEVKIIDYYPEELHKSEKQKGLKKLGRNFIRFFDFRKSEKVFGNFLKNNLKLTQRYYSLDQLKKDPPKGDLYIVGSDQVWNCNTRNGNDDSYFLTFVPKNKIKASYAASIAMDELTNEQKKRFSDKLKDFYAISVREKTAVKLLNECKINIAEKVLDPVFLLDKNNWDELANKSKLNLKDEKYIFVYGFKRQKNIYQYARKLAKEKGCKVFSVNTNIEDYLLDVDKYFYNVSPEDFLNLLRNAEAVVTNSFHGLSFSIIYRKNVHQFMKSGKENSRMIDLLNELNMSERLVENGEIIEEDFNYNETAKIIEEERKGSINFLDKLCNADGGKNGQD